jgi:hypothetical protein
LEAIINSGLNEDVDLTIKYLQIMLETGQANPDSPTLNAMQKVMLKRESSLSGNDGMKMSRAAFAVIIKFCDLLDDFTNLTDAVSIETQMNEGPDQEKSVIE